MLTAKGLRGTPIIHVDGGNKVGSADLVVFSPEERRLVGFIMTNGGVLHKDRQVVMADDVRAMGPDAITIDDDAVVRPFNQADEPFRQALESGQRLFGTQVVTESGDVLGTVDDLFLDPSSARVTSIALKGGISTSSDAIPIERLVSVGRDAVIVTDGPL